MPFLKGESRYTTFYGNELEVVDVFYTDLDSNTVLPVGLLRKDVSEMAINLLNEHELTQSLARFRNP